jgi:phosphatidylinositol glycan class M
LQPEANPASPQALWLSIAYRLEFLGEPAYIQLWGAGIAFLAANSFVIAELALAYH